MMWTAIPGFGLALLAFARGEPGDAGRSPDAAHAHSAGG
jgi:hypothetical protein